MREATPPPPLETPPTPPDSLPPPLSLPQQPSSPIGESPAAHTAVSKDLSRRCEGPPACITRTTRYSPQEGFLTEVSSSPPLSPSKEGRPSSPLTVVVASTSADGRQERLT
ncbi:MAG: hypothetical protein ACK559_02900, partial [bacterium]